MLANIISHSKKNDTTTTVEFGKKTLTENVVLDIEDITNGDIINDTSLFHTLSMLKTPFLLGFPRIVSPEADTLITTTTIFRTSEPILNDAVEGTIDSVHWQVSDQEDFSHILLSRYYRPEELPDGDITKFDPKKLAVKSGYVFIRMRYVMDKLASPWSIPVRFNMPSLKVAIPTIQMTQNELTPSFTVSNYTLTDEYIASEGNDTLKEVVWGLSKLPKDRATDYVEKLLTIGYEPEYTYRKAATAENPYTLNFPFVDSNTGTVVKLTAEDDYVLTCILIGNKYSSIMMHMVFTAGNYKVLAPKFTLRQFELIPEINIEGFGTTGGHDELDNYQIIVTEHTVTGSGIVMNIVHTIKTPANFYVLPVDIVKPNTTYDFAVIAIGKKYGASDPTVISMTMPSTGIRAPKVNVTNKGMEPYITLSPFETINSTDTMRGTEWELYNHANVEGDRLIERWVKENQDTFLKIGKNVVETNTNYKIKVRYLGHKYKSPWVELPFKTINIIISKPLVTAQALGLSIKADITNYSVIGDVDTPDSVIWNVYEVTLDHSGGPDVEPKEIIVNHLVDTKVQKWGQKILNINIRDGVKKDTRYKVVGKILGVNYSSPWSDPVYVTTPNIFILKPEVTVTGEPNQVPKFPEFKTSEFKTNMEIDTHVSTTWRVEDLSGNKVFESIEDRDNKTSLILLDDVLMPNATYVIKVIHHGELYGDSARGEKQFTTRPNFIEVPEDGDGMDTVIVGDDGSNETTKYYGKFTFDRLDNTRNYLGNWDGSYEYPFGSQVLYQGRLWHALDTSAHVTSNSHLNLNRIPGRPSANGVVYWEEDERNIMPTYDWLVRQIGLQANVKDNNATGITTGSLFRGEWDQKDTSPLGKYMVGMKVLYIYDHTELTNISLNDLAVLGLRGKGRTIRIGERLFYLRLPTAAEHRELYRFKVVEDTQDKIALNLTKEIWLADEIDSDVDGLVGLGNGESVREDASKRNKALRFVLEYIPQYEEPWLFARKKYPTLKYDRYTDTGYFGTVEVNGFDFHAAIGLTTGIKINRGVSMLAFYNHGRRILVNRMPISYGVSFDKLQELNVVYGKDVKIEGKSNVVITNFNNDGKKYSVRLLRGGFLYTDLPDILELNQDTLMSVNNIFKGSEWNELIYRVALQIPNHKDRNGFHGGWQIGSNWDTFDNIGVGVFEHYSGNGSHDFVLSFVSNNRIMSRGGTKLEAVYFIEEDVVRNDHGVRLVFEDDTIFTRDV